MAVLYIASAAEPWSNSDLIQPAELAAWLRAAGGPKPKIFYVGYGILYRGKHIPGAIFIGPTEKQERLQALRSELMKVPRTAELVIYCGCCPVEKCPNIRPAFHAVRELGFKRTKLLWLPTNFLKDWIEKGYPIETGSPPPPNSASAQPLQLQMP